MGSQTYGPFRADVSRPDIAAALAIEDRHGFDIRVPLPAGGYGVACAYGVNIGPAWAPWSSVAFGGAHRARGFGRGSPHRL